MHRTSTDFSVVEFTETYEVAIVPSKWLVGKEYSMWPTWKSINRTEKAVRQLEHPDETFATHPIRIMYQTDSYQKARDKLKKAEMTSDLQTEDEPDYQPEDKRKRRPTSRYQSISDSSETDTSPVKGKDGDLLENLPKASKKSYPPLPCLPPFPQSSPRPSPQVSPKPTLNLKKPCLQEQPVASPSSKTVSAVEKKILTVLEDLKAAVNHNTKLLNILIKKTETTTEEFPGSELPDGVSLPLNSIEQFEATEELLKNEIIVKQLTSNLGTIGGDSVTECARRTMKYVMSNQLAIQFNWKGLGEKRAFGTSRFLVIIRKAIRKNRLTAMASDSDIDSVIKDWLRFAKDREGGRKKRALEKRRREATDVDKE